MFLWQDSEDDIVTNFELADAILAKAKVPKTGKVCLWLGVSDQPRSHVAELTLAYDRPT